MVLETILVVDNLFLKFFSKWPISKLYIFWHKDRNTAQWFDKWTDIHSDGLKNQQTYL